MQQQNNKKYKSNARAWYLPGYHFLSDNSYLFEPTFHGFLLASAVARVA
jgi:hypothetical protein